MGHPRLWVGLCMGHPPKSVSSRMMTVALTTRSRGGACGFEDGRDVLRALSGLLLNGLANDLAG